MIEWLNLVRTVYTSFSELMAMVYAMLMIPPRFSARKNYAAAGCAWLVLSLMDIYSVYLRGTAFIFLLLPSTLIFQGTVLFLSQYRDTRTLFAGLTASTFAILAQTTGDVAHALSGSLALGLLFGTAALGGLLFICIRVIREPYRRLYHTSSAVFRWLFVMPVLFYAGLFVLAYWPRSLLENKQNILPCVILILLIPASYLLEFALLNSERAKAEYEHRQSQLEAYVKGLERQNGNLQDCQLKSRIVRHDMRHFVGSLSVLLAEGRIAQAQEVLADITQSIDASKAEVYCENPIINSVLYGQLAQAKANHIAVTDSMDIPAQLGDAVNVTELAGVLANLLENAVNAVLHLPETERWLLLSAKCTDTQLIITMKNPYAGSLRLSPETGLPESAAGEEHGFGMRSIAAFTERYHAIFDFEAEGHIFKVHLLVRR